MLLIIAILIALASDFLWHIDRNLRGLRWLFEVELERKRDKRVAEAELRTARAEAAWREDEQGGGADPHQSRERIRAKHLFVFPEQVGDGENDARA